MIKRLFATAPLLVMAGLSASVVAQEEFKPETVTMIETVPAGTYLYAGEGGMINVIEPEEFKSYGTFSEVGQTVYSKISNIVYTTRNYYERGRDGARTDTIRTWDLSKLTAINEATILPRAAMTGNHPSLFAASEDEKWLFVQNATPATSVTVFGVPAFAVASEVPLPGCWGIYPQQKSSLRFVSLCGDGRLSTVLIDAEGKYVNVERSEKIFDVDSDPLFTQAVRLKDTLYFVSFNGNVYEIDISGNAAKLKKKTSLVTEKEAGWKPSGAAPLALVEKASVLYVLMRSKTFDGSHKESANEVWAFDLKKGKVISRSSVEDAVIAKYYDGKTPALFVGTKTEGLVRYIAAPDAGYTVRKEKRMKMGRVSSLEIK